MHFYLICTVEVDYIIVGQGICGTMLSFYLLKAGKRILVVDNKESFTASKVASGIINPVTGRRVVKTWMIDDLLPFAQDAYESIGALIDVELVKEMNLISFHSNEQMSSTWHERVAQGEEYISNGIDLDYYGKYFNIGYGAGVVLSSMLVDLETLLTKWRLYLKEKNSLIEDVFFVDELKLSDSHLFYHDIKFEKIVFCDGINGYNNPYFEKLPFALTKGEVLRVEIRDLPQNKIYKQGVSLVPIGNEQFWVGSSFEWEFKDALPTEAFRLKTERQLNALLKLPFNIIDHIASVRPGSVERRPFVGHHPHYQNIGILNGMGTKGCSLAPYFARQLCEHIINGHPILPEVDIQRFKKLLIGS